MPSSRCLFVHGYHISSDVCRYLERSVSPREDSLETCLTFFFGNLIIGVKVHPKVRIANAGRIQHCRYPR